MNPVRRALDRWKQSNPDGTVEQFAAELGYKQPDTVYRLMRDEFAPPLKRMEMIADLADMTLGRVAAYFAKNVSRRTA